MVKPVAYGRTTVRSFGVGIVGALALGLSMAWTAPATAAAKKAPAKVSKAAAPTPSAAVAQVADWIIGARDSGGLPFMVVDKVTAQVFVYEADGRLRGGAPALLGFARGDGSVPGIGDRKLSAIRPGERTTPAGRFIAAYGPAAGRGKVLWVDFATAISIHPVVTSNPKERRARRLASRSAKDNRITYGCINVSAGFYEDVVRRTFTGTRGVVYILPETEPLETVFPGLGLTQAKAAPVAEPAAAVTVAKSEATPTAGSDAGPGGP